MARIVFRCDASSRSGSGHVARCMALARALRVRGAELELVTRDLEPRLRSLLVDVTGSRIHDLHADRPHTKTTPDEGAPLAHADWLGVPQHVDAAQTAAVLRAGSRAEWLIVDHYALDARWETRVRPYAARTLVIDDLADRNHACDALLDQNFFASPETRYVERVASGVELMLGPRYALLREEFGAARKLVGERDGRLTRIFVCFGGFDAAGQTSRALDAIGRSGLDRIAVDVVIASDHRERGRIEAACAAQRNWSLHFDAARIAELMAPADLAIGASGIMNWERAALKLPAIVTSVADNQHRVAQELAADRACIYLGRADAWVADTLAALLRGLAGAPTLVSALSARAAELTDGHGARRVAARLLPEAITLRRAQGSDCEPMHAWRNAAETRRHAHDPAPIAPAVHRAWFERVQADPAVALLIGERRDGPVGVLRYDIDGRHALVSVYLVPGAYGRGLGAALLRAGTSWMREHHPGVRELRAAIRCGNAASLAAFANAGYRLESHDYTLELRHE